MDYLNHALTIYYAIITTGQFDYFKTFIIYLTLFLIIFMIIYVIIKK